MDAGHRADDTVCTGKTPVTGCGGDRIYPLRMAGWGDINVIYGTVTARPLACERRAVRGWGVHGIPG